MINEKLGPSGISVGFGTAVLPFEAHDPVQALVVADGRVVGAADGQPIPRAADRRTGKQQAA